MEKELRQISAKKVDGGIEVSVTMFLPKQNTSKIILDNFISKLNIVIEEKTDPILKDSNLSFKDISNTLKNNYSICRHSTIENERPKFTIEDLGHQVKCTQCNTKFRLVDEIKDNLTNEDILNILESIKVYYLDSDVKSIVYVEQQINNIKGERFVDLTIIKSMFKIACDNFKSYQSNSFIDNLYNRVNNKQV